MNVEDAKIAIKALAELHATKTSAAQTLKDSKQENWNTKRLWREGNKSNLIKIGMALVAFPEPTPASEIIGAGFIAAGAVQKGIKSRAVYMEDITKTLSSTLKQLADTK